MNDESELWGCNLGCGEFRTKSAYIRCPKCGTRKVHFIGDANCEDDTK